MEETITRSASVFIGTGVALVPTAAGQVAISAAPPRQRSVDATRDEDRL
jgi:hypothetical protein